MDKPLQGGKTRRALALISSILEACERNVLGHIAAKKNHPLVLETFLVFYSGKWTGPSRSGQLKDAYLGIMLWSAQDVFILPDGGNPPAGLRGLLGMVS
jgi:hypothetical protein